MTKKKQKVTSEYKMDFEYLVLSLAIKNSDRNKSAIIVSALLHFKEMYSCFLRQQQKDRHDVMTYRDALFHFFRKLFAYCATK